VDELNAAMEMSKLSVAIGAVGRAVRVKVIGAVFPERNSRGSEKVPSEVTATEPTDAGKVEVTLLDVRYWS